MTNHNTLPEEGYLRLKQIIGDAEADPPQTPIIPVSKSTWYAGIKRENSPHLINDSADRISVWRVADIPCVN